MAALETMPDMPNAFAVPESTTEPLLPLIVVPELTYTPLPSVSPPVPNMVTDAPVMPIVPLVQIPLPRPMPLSPVRFTAPVELMLPYKFSAEALPEPFASILTPPAPEVIVPKY